jgi:hypothetical protein
MQNLLDRNVWFHLQPQADSTYFCFSGAICAGVWVYSSALLWEDYRCNIQDSLKVASRFGSILTITGTHIWQIDRFKASDNDIVYNKRFISTYKFFCSILWFFHSFMGITQKYWKIQNIPPTSTYHWFESAALLYKHSSVQHELHCEEKHYK